MRASTRNLISAVGLGTLAASYVIGMNASAAAGFSASGLTGTQAPPSPTPTSQAADSPTPVSTPTSAETSATPAQSATGSSQSKKSTSSTSSLKKVTNAVSSVTKSGSAVDYQYGTVQVSVTKSNGKITAIDLVQAGATHGREAAFSYLVDAAISAQGTSFGNITGATFTTDAFKQALDSALGKF